MIAVEDAHETQPLVEFPAEPVPVKGDPNRWTYKGQVGTELEMRLIYERECKRLALEKAEQLRSVFQAFLDGPPAQMLTPLGTLPVNADGMRLLVDALSRANRALEADKALRQTNIKGAKA